MPRETYTTIAHSLRVDAAAVSRATALVPLVQASYNAYQDAVYGNRIPDDVDIGYVYMVAIRVGLNRWPPNSEAAPAGARPTGATFVIQTGTGVHTITVNVVDADQTVANTIATAVGVTLNTVLSAALCTGLGAMVGEAVAKNPGSVPAFGPF